MRPYGGSLNPGRCHGFRSVTGDDDDARDDPRVHGPRGHPARGGDAARRPGRARSRGEGRSGEGEADGAVGTEPSDRVRRAGPVDGRSRTVRRSRRSQPARHDRVRHPGTRRRQRRDPPQVRHRGTARAVPPSARRRRDPQLLLDDRAGDRRLEPGPARHHRGHRRRRLRDQRPEVVHLLGRRRRVRHRHGRHRPRRAAAPAGEHDHRPHRHARLQPGAQRQRDGPRRLGPRQPRRSDLPVVPRAADQPARARGRRVPDRPGPPRSGPHPPLHALAGHRLASLRHDVRPAPTNGSSTSTVGGSPTSRSSSTGPPSSTPRSAAPGCRRCTRRG